MRKKAMIHVIGVSLMVLVPVCSASAVPVRPLALWFQQPANDPRTEALPIGNGKLGGLVLGGVEKERVALSEISLWTGKEVSTDDYDRMGAYQALGDLIVELKDPPAKAEDYRRELDLAAALHTVSYRSGDVTYRREAFVSHADQVMVLRFSGDRPAACSATLRLAGAHKETTSVEGNALGFRGVLGNGLKYEAKVVVLNEGGAAQADGNAITFRNCNSFTLLVATGTDYVMDCDRGFRGADPHGMLVKRLADAAAKPWVELKAAHLKDYQALFDRVALDVGQTAADRLAMPTDRRKVLEAAQGDDPDLDELMFQYGRYLMISSSRPGGLPANLQGLWNDDNDPPWHSDYHSNINVQMNYWPAEAANLSECHTPLFDLITSQIPAWRKATAADKRFQTPSGSSRGWAVRTSHGINGDTAWKWDVTANAWYCQHFFRHYEFNGDKAWLKTVAYPVMKETCEFWEDRLKELPNGKLVVPNGWSPEHGPENVDGVSYCQEMVWDLFSNYVAATEALGIDEDYGKKIAGLRGRLLVPQIGKWGQLQEWMDDIDDPNDGHRHTSHLFAVYPGQQIGMTRTPELAAAARKSLLARIEAKDAQRIEWAFTWRTALFARLHDGDNAHAMFSQFFGNGITCHNLLGLIGGAMQIDGNFGATAGVCEMLVQSHEDDIVLLPALPKAWSNGSVRGLCARGGCEVDIAWKDGKVTDYHIRSTPSREVRVRVNGEVKTVNTK